MDSKDSRRHLRPQSPPTEPPTPEPVSSPDPFSESDESDDSKEDPFSNDNRVPGTLVPPPPAYVAKSKDEDDSQHEIKLVTLKDHRPKNERTDTTNTAATFDSLEEPKVSWRQRLNPFGGRHTPPVPETRTTISPEYSASFISLLTFQWMQPVMWTGYRRQLEMNDIPLLNPKRGVDSLGKKLRRSFERRKVARERFPLLKAMHETFKFEFWLGGVCRLFADLFAVFSPFTTRYLINFAAKSYYFHNPSAIGGEQIPKPPIASGLGLVLGIFVMQILQSAGATHFVYHGMMCGGESRSVLMSMILEKALKMSNRAKAGGAPDQSQLDPNAPQPSAEEGGWSHGKIINVMASDTARIEHALGSFHTCWTAPLALLITLGLLIYNISYNALSGMGLLVIGTFLLAKAIKAQFQQKTKIHHIVDKRVSLTSEVFAAIRFVKYFAWESSFLERLHQFRTDEVAMLKSLLTVRSAVTSVSMSLPVLASMVSFVTLAFDSNSFENRDTAAKIFSSLALFNALRVPLNMLPWVIGLIVDGYGSVQRIERFLLAEDTVDPIDWDDTAVDAITLQNASFTWEPLPVIKPKKSPKQIKAEKKAAKKTPKTQAGAISSPVEKQVQISGPAPFTITPFNLTVGRDEIVAIIGSVGCGKSSLLSALSGDMRMTGGQVKLGAARAYCPGSAWIQNTTVRNNILFGKEYNKAWYDRVVEACALKPDMKIFDNGDQTEIGERGITVSGGQKQRLSIARAVYRNADIILMDDPLSAVDAHVSKHLFDHVMCGLLKGKSRVLATHQLHVLHRCDRIVWMEHGRIRTIDTYKNLMAHNEAFKDMMANAAEKKKEDEEEEEEKKKEEAKPADDKKDEDEEEEKEKEEEKEDEKPKKKDLMSAESKSSSSVPWSVYIAFVRASGTILNAPLIAVLCLASQTLNIITSQWLSWWISKRYPLPKGVYCGIYLGLGVMQVFLLFAFSTLLAVASTNASKNLFKQAIERVLGAPMSFFDTTPMGRIMNRFTKDVDTLDVTIADSMRMYFTTVTMTMAIFILITVYFWYFIIALIVLFFFLYYAANFYRSSAREMKRLEAILRSVVYARFNEILSGSTSIRAYQVESHFTKTLSQAIDNMNSVYFLTYANQRWLSVRIDVVSILLVLITMLLVVTSTVDINPSVCGLVLSYILAIVQMLQFSVRQLAEVESAMNSAERVYQYGVNVDQEPPRKLQPVEDNWPNKGAVTFANADMRYRADLPLVLNNLSMDIKGGERVGIVGRTGAGKSTIITSLFRMTELSGGSITIDGHDISKLGLEDLRSRLSIIPQDPTLFQGTVRSNLDPFNQSEDIKMWQVLRTCGLVRADEPEDAADNEEELGQKIGLETVVEEEGANFSLGQRQLLALARALLRDSQIIVFDEATSAIDMETDAMIQRMIQNDLKGKTLLCIAHRLRTIITYDRICVMDKGSIAELGTPFELFLRPEGIFRSMCVQSGITEEDFDSYSADVAPPPRPRTNRARSRYDRVSRYSGVPQAASSYYSSVAIPDDNGRRPSAIDRLSAMPPHRSGRFSRFNRMTMLGGGGLDRQSQWGGDGIRLSTGPRASQWAANIDFEGYRPASWYSAYEA
ncbi:MAG: hypothetical protein M1828_000411 [Chrysothrix sp. TS-e1954]|nr:MAG: hypothetical protein M1828_000411 [Chrysothrix sp. TS-e1954]